jgi:hypothetical protein
VRSTLQAIWLLVSDLFSEPTLVLSLQFIPQRSEERGDESRATGNYSKRRELQSCSTTETSNDQQRTFD